LLGIEQPVVQAPIGTAAVPRLAAAVSNAGALGMVSLTWTPDVASVIGQTAELTARPFGGNLVLEWDQHRRLAAALEAGLRIVSLTWGDPAPYVETVHRAGGLVLHTVGSAAQARQAGGRRPADRPLLLGAAAGGDDRGYRGTVDVGGPERRSGPPHGAGGRYRRRVDLAHSRPPGLTPQP
jgi:NAD(P)H-dependent flavin oxidoreductase YrpB (nitropropane dioxygenase family)